VSVAPFLLRGGLPDGVTIPQMRAESNVALQEKTLENGAGIAI
jgi:hypothetical protein